MSSNPKALIFGIRGKELLPEEAAFIHMYNPLGFILFSRNIDNKIQVQKLVKQLKTATGRDSTPIMLDQEGGRVARLKEPNWRHPPEAAIFGAIATSDLPTATKVCRINAALMAYDLHELDINVVCAPLLDILFTDTHSVIGNRAFSPDKEVIASLGNAMIKGFVNCGVVPIIKHIPGHGRARADSHLELPMVDASYNSLLDNDFYPFIKLATQAPWAMTAHILYNSIDADNVATFSKAVIDEIRKTIGFKGIIITDCITMKALAGNMCEKAKKSFAAGCDVVLHSNGNLDEMTEIALVSPVLSDLQYDIIKEGFAKTKPPAASFDYGKLSAEFNRILCDFGIICAYPVNADPTECLLRLDPENGIA